MLEERTGDVGVPLIDGPHERGLPAQPLFRIDVGAARDEQPDDGHAAAPGRRHQRRFARLQRHVGIRASLEQSLQPPERCR